MVWLWGFTGYKLGKYVPLFWLIVHSLVLALTEVLAAIRV